MKQKVENIPAVIPPALDPEEAELAARSDFLIKNEFLDEEDFVDATEAERNSDEILFDENDFENASPDADEATQTRRAKFRKSLIFLTIFGAGFGIFAVFLAWAFGFGFFAPTSRVSIDRNQKSNSVESGATTNGDEKLKTALSIVAGDNGNNQNSPVISDSSTNPKTTAEQDLTLSSGEKTKELSNNQAANNQATDGQNGGNMIVLPNEKGNVQSNSADKQTRTSQPNLSGSVTQKPNLSNQNEPDANLGFQPGKNQSSGEKSTNNADGAAPARSVFFGRIPNQTNSVPSISVSQNSPPTNEPNFGRNSNISNESTNVPPFGTLLSVRLLGAVFTLPGSGNLVRMELSRAIKQNGFSYPAGTVLVGRLRGSETNRAFISVFGAIDPKSGKLIKFEGEVTGTDGASGILGTRKSIKSWGNRFLSALREVGGNAVNVLSSRSGRGGTIVLGGSNGVSGEVSSVIRGNDVKDSFVVVKAGTEAYVLITDLPGELPKTDLNESLTGNQAEIPGLNLSEAEMAELLVTDDANKIRAAFLKMSPQFRALALQAMEKGKN